MTSLLVIFFVELILFGYSFHLSFAKTSNEKEEYNKNIEYTELSINKMKLVKINYKNLIL
jgi:hypothetical protein